MADNWQKVSRDNWRYRRRVVFVSLSFVALMVAFILGRALDTGLYRDGMVALIGAGVAIIGSYVFGAVWDDNSKRRFTGPPEEPEE